MVHQRPLIAAPFWKLPEKKDREPSSQVYLNLPRFRLHPYAAVLAAPSICLASNSSGLRCPSAEWIRTRL